MDSIASERSMTRFWTPLVRGPEYFCERASERRIYPGVVVTREYLAKPKEQNQLGDGQGPVSP